jgi:hypothetical protein
MKAGIVFITQFNFISFRLFFRMLSITVYTTKFVNCFVFQNELRWKRCEPQNDEVN